MLAAISRTGHRHHHLLLILETNVSLIVIYCLTLFVIVYNDLLYVYSIKCNAWCMGGTCVSSLIIIETTINQLEKNVSLNNNLLPEVICYCLQTCNVVASDLMVGGTCVPSLIVIGTTINQL